MIEIETPWLWLRPMRAGDAEGLLRVFGDPQVMAAFGAPPFDRAQMDRWVRRNLDHQDRHGYGLCTAIFKAEDRIIGDCGLTRMDLAGATEVELGYDFCSDYWNRGLATEAATAARDYAFGALGLPRLVSLIRQGNAASRRVAEKVGLRHEADLTEHGVDYWLYAIARAAPREP